MLPSFEERPFTVKRRSRMRAVIADHDVQRRETVRRMVLTDDTYQLVGEAFSAEQCVEIVAHESPELAICNRLFAHVLLQAGHLFPFLITIASSEGLAFSERVVCNLDAQILEAQMQRALALAASRIVQSKVDSLLTLISAYLLHGASAARDRFEVEDDRGQAVSLGAEDVLWIKAAGNYVQLYTETGIFEMRETISNMASKLEPSGFTRIHRGIVVNDRAVRERRSNDGRIASVVLQDGTELLVGPNFRDQLLPLTG